jgi:hypothetical protein
MGNLIMKQDNRQLDFKSKRPYLPPAVTKLTPEQAKQFVAEHIHCSDQEAANFLDSLRQEQQRKET